MTDYSYIVPEDLQLEWNPQETGFCVRHYEHPIEEFYSRVQQYRIAIEKHGRTRINTKKLRRDLSEGGELSSLLDRVIAGHSVEWDGRHVGSLTHDAKEAQGKLANALTSGAYEFRVERDCN